MTKFVVALQSLAIVLGSLAPIVARANDQHWVEGHTNNSGNYTGGHWAKTGKKKPKKLRSPSSTKKKSGSKKKGKH